MCKIYSPEEKLPITNVHCNTDRSASPGMIMPKLEHTFSLNRTVSLYYSSG